MLFVGTSIARNHATPSHTKYDSNEFGTIVTTFSPASTPDSSQRGCPPALLAVELGVGDLAALDVHHRDAIGSRARVRGDGVRQHEVSFEHQSPRARGPTGP